MKNKISFFTALIITVICFDGMAMAQQEPVPDVPAPTAVVEPSQNPAPPLNPDATAPVVGEMPLAAASPTDGEDQKPLNVDNLFAPSTDIEKAISEQLKFVNPSVNVNLMPSLLFTVWEHDLIIDARRGLKTGLSITSIESTKGQAISDISLGGIVYKSASNWTIWLNNTRITPDAIPTQILDLEVTKDFIKVEWFDSTRNLIFPIKLRPHQRFNLDTRLFLSGQ